MRELYLRVLEEAVGSFEGVELDDHGISIHIGKYSVRLNDDQNSAKEIIQKLKQIPLGSRIGILRVSDLKPRILMRVYENAR
jgi:hypothetical protein